MAGFFDLSDPDNAALLGMASGLLQAGAPSRLPMPLGVALGRSLQAGIQAGQRAEAGNRLRADPLAVLRRRLAAAGPAPYGMGPIGAWPGVWGAPPVLR